MQQFLAENKKYPPSALEHQIEGTVTVRYTIDYKGRVIQTRILSGIGYGCDEEAERIISLLKFTVPSTRKLKVQYHKTAHIHFKLPAQTSKTPSVQYQINLQKKENSNEEKPKSYHYQIKW